MEALLGVDPGRKHHCCGVQLVIRSATDINYSIDLVSYTSK